QPRARGDAAIHAASGAAILARRRHRSARPRCQRYRLGAQRHHYLPGPQRRPGADRAIRPGPIAAGARAATMTPCCLQDDRRDAVRRREGWNGLDYVELAEDGQTLRAYFLGKLPPELAGPSA